MEVIHQNQPYEDTVGTITEREHRNPGFVEAEQKVETLFRSLGAVVNYGLSYTGERPGINLFIPDEQSEAMIEFSNRPA